MPAYEMKRLSEAFDRLKLLSNELSCLSIRVNVEHCSDQELHRAAIYCQLSGDVREVVNRYRTDLDELEEVTPGKLEKCVTWACAALAGGGKS